MKIVSHTLIKNEENFVWFSLNSVVDYVDEMMVWVMKSGDKTLEIVESIKNPKIKIKALETERSEDLSVMRQKMLDETDSDWVFVLDGDEIWHEESIKELVERVSEAKSNTEVAVSPFKMLVGDIFHYQEDLAGRYKIGSKEGHLTVRAMRRNIKGLYVDDVYPREGYAADGNVKIQDLPKDKMIFLDKAYLHASHLVRSSANKEKYKYEIGHKFSKDYYYPEVLFCDRPSIVPCPWRSMSMAEWSISNIMTPLRKLKRRII